MREGQPCLTPNPSVLLSGYQGVRVLECQAWVECLGREKGKTKSEVVVI